VVCRATEGVSGVVPKIKVSIRWKQCVRIAEVKCLRRED